MRNKNLDTVDRFFAAYGSRDKAGVEACFHPDIVARQAAGHPYGGTYRGPKRVMEMLDAIGSTYSMEQFAIPHTFFDQDPDHIAFEFALGGKVKATGKSFDTTVIEHWAFKDGKVIGIGVHWFEIP